MGAILVTGGTGFLGQHIIELLARSGRKVRTLNRTRDAALEKLGAELITGSILETDSLKRSLEGCEAVFHLAGKVDRDRRGAAEMFRLHVEGTRAVMNAAKAAGVRRVVYASTSGIVGCSRSPDAVATEQTPYPEELSRRWPYYASKLQAEREALEAARAGGPELICVNPSLLLGPGDSRASSTGDVLRVLQRKLPALPSGGVNFVDVRDVAAGTVAALEKGRPGERYVLGGANWSLAQFFQRVGELSGVKVPRMRLPDAPARWAAYTLDPVFHLLGIPSPLDPGSVEMSQVFWYVDSAKAERELGFKARPPDDTLRDTIEDLRRRHAKA